MANELWNEWLKFLENKPDLGVPQKHMLSAAFQMKKINCEISFKLS